MGEPDKRLPYETRGPGGRLSSKDKCLSAMWWVGHIKARCSTVYVPLAYDEYASADVVSLTRTNLSRVGAQLKAARQETDIGSTGCNDILPTNACLYQRHKLD